MASNYAIYKNGKVIKTGFKQFSSERDEETFVLKMQQRYMTNDNDCIDVWFK